MEAELGDSWYMVLGHNGGLLNVNMCLCREKEGYRPEVVVRMEAFYGDKYSTMLCANLWILSEDVLRIHTGSCLYFQHPLEM